MLHAVVNLSQLVESDARREEAQHRERHQAALIAAIVCRIWQDRSRIGPSVRQQPPRFSNITETEAWHDFRFKERRGNSFALNRCVHCGFHARWCFAVGPPSMRKLRFAFSSVA